VLHNRNVALVTAARFIARLGGEAAFFIGVWGMAAYRFDATSAEIALLMAVLAIASMVGAAISGSLVDRYGPRNVLIGAQIVYIPIVLAVTLVTSIEQLIGACALFGLSTAPIMTATGSFAPYLTSDSREVERVNAVFEGAGALSFVVGPGLGALVAKAFGIESVFYLDAVLTTLGVLLVLPVHTPPLGTRKQHHPLREIAEGLRVTYSIRPVRFYVLMGTLVWFSFGAFGALEPLFYRDVVGTGVETIGWVNSIFGVGIATGAFVLTRLPAKATSARGLTFGIMGVGLGSVLYIGTTDLRVIALGAIVWGAMIGGVEPLLRTLMQLDAPEEYIGRVMGTAQLHRSAGELVPLAVAPALSAIFGVQKVMMGGGLIAAAVAVASLGVAASIDRAGHRPHGPVTPEQAMPRDEPISPIT
jgi:predicted MFS family arabinose efflux permease